MQWINETDENDRNLAHHCLVLEAHEPLAPAFVAYWKRILSDGRSKAAAWGWRSLSIEILEQQSEADDPGHMRTGFRDAQRKACDGAGDYFLRSHAFACLQGRDEDNKAFSRKQSRWYLEQYAALKNAADSGEVEQLFREINNIRPLFIDAATGWGWFDLQVGQDSFGRLPAEDEALLAGTERKPADRLLDLIGGRDMMTIMQELNAALVAYTTENFRTICCEITEGVEQGQRALFYNIQCPQFPDDGTTVVNDQVHKAATRLVQQMAPASGAFAGLAIQLEQRNDGTWRSSYKMMSSAAA